MESNGSLTDVLEKGKTDILFRRSDFETTIAACGPYRQDTDRHAHSVDLDLDDDSQDVWQKLKTVLRAHNGNPHEPVSVYTQPVIQSNAGAVALALLRILHEPGLFSRAQGVRHRGEYNDENNNKPEGPPCFLFTPNAHRLIVQFLRGSIPVGPHDESISFHCLSRVYRRGSCCETGPAKTTTT